MNQQLSSEKVSQVNQYYEDFVNEAIKPEPNRKWYDVSIDGLTKAALNLNELGEPVIQLASKVLKLLSVGML
jgi:hypothetical protein